MLFTVLKTIQAFLLVIGYPLFIYYLITHNLAWLGAILVLGLILWKIHHRSNQLWWILGLSILIFITYKLFGIDTIPKMSPLLIHSGLFYLFSQSLKSTPLIEQFARLEHPEMPREVEVYCRQLTILWCGFFALNIAGGLWLALQDNDSLWVLYNSVIVYLLIATLVLGEYAWRRIRFPDLEIAPFYQTINNTIKNGHKIWKTK